MRFTLVILSAALCLNARATSLSNDKESDEAIMAAAEKLVSEGQPAKSAEAKVVAPAEAAVLPAAQGGVTASEIAQDIKKESETPIFSKSDKLAKTEGSLLWRLLASMAFIAVVGGALIYAGRRWTRQKNQGGQKARIEVLHQFHMGPKKSVALIRVAGEAILIGCTDHNVNMIKSVTLIDDEMEGALGKDFNAFLEDEFTVEDMRTALAPRARI